MKIDIQNLLKLAGEAEGKWPTFDLDTPLNRYGNALLPEVIKALCEVVVAAKRSVLAADGFIDDGTVATHLEFNEADEALRKALEPFTEE